MNQHPNAYRAAQRICLALAILLTSSAVLAQNGDSPEQRQIEFAHGLFHRGFLSEALDEYSVYLESFPGGAHVSEAWLRIGEGAASLGDFERAVQAYGEAVKGYGPETEAGLAVQLGLGEALYFLENLEAAEGPLQIAAASASPPEYRGRALYYLGRIAQHRGDEAAALTSYELLLSAVPDHSLSPFARYQLAILLASRGDLERAAVEFASVAGGSADDSLRAESRFRAAEAYDKLGWYGSAIGEYDQLRAGFPDSVFVRRAEHGYAWSLYRDGQFEAAANAAKTFLDNHPESALRAAMAFLRASCFQQLENYPAAIEAFDALASEHAATEYGIRAAYKAAWVQYLMGDLSGAKQRATVFVQQYPEATELGQAAFLLGTILVAEGSYEQAHRQFRLVADRYPDSTFGPDALYKAAECQSQLGLPSQAAEAFSAFAERYPEHPLRLQALLRAGNAYFDTNDGAAAIERFQAALAAGPDAGLEHDIQYRLAVALLQENRNEEGATAFRRLLEAFPESPNRAQANYQLGALTLREQDDPVQAIAYFESALEQEADTVLRGRILRDLALSRYEHKDFDQAANLFLRLMKEHPDIVLNEETYAWTGQHFFDLEQWDAASEVLTTLLRVAPEYPNPERVLFKIAESVERSGNGAVALEAYQRVIDRSPTSTAAVEASYRMAEILEGHGEVERALELYEEAANANSGDLSARARFRIGEIYVDQEAYEKAARSFMRVAILFLHPELSPESLWRAGQAYEKSGNGVQAIRAYNELLSDFPESPTAEKAKAARDALAQGE